MTDEPKPPEEEKIDPDTIQVKVFSSYHNYYEGPALSISAVNDTGPFDILPKHHNFMTLINQGELVVRSKGSEDKVLNIMKGVMHVRKNKVTVFLDV